MTILQALKQLRDDLRIWVIANLNALNAKIDEKTILIDEQLDSNSANPVQNKVVTNAINNIPRFSGDYNDLTNAPNITEDDSGNMTIADESGNVIFKVDADGIHTTALTINGENIDVKDADTLDGKHADEFASKSDIEDLEEKVNNCGNANIFVVNTYEDHTNSIIYSADKTSQEIYQAWADGQIIVCKHNSDGLRNIELQPVAFYPETAVFSNSVIVSDGEDVLNQYFCLVISGSNVQEFDASLATEDYVRNLVNTKSQVQIITWGADD